MPNPEGVTGHGPVSHQSKPSSSATSTTEYDAFDVGPLAASRRFAPGTPAQHAHLDPEDGMLAAPGRPVSADDLAKLLAA